MSTERAANMGQLIASPSLKRATRPADRNLAPLRQGDLDGLCGVYAIINTLRRTTAEADTIKRSAWPWVFAELLRELDVLVGSAYAVAYGIDTKPLWKLSKRAVRLLADEYGLSIELARPLKRRTDLDLALTFSWLDAAASDRQAGVLIGLAGALDHWSVVASVSATYLTLFDSSAHRRVRLDRCALGPSQPETARHGIDLSAIFEFRINRG